MRGHIIIILAILTISSMLSTCLSAPMNIRGRPSRKTLPRDPLATRRVGKENTKICHNDQIIAAFGLDKKTGNFHMTRLEVEDDWDDLALFNERMKCYHPTHLKPTANTIAVPLKDIPGWRIDDSYQVHYFGTHKIPNPQT